MRGKELADQLRLVSREIIDNHVNLFPARLAGNDRDQKRDEVGRRVTRRRPPEYLSCFGV